MSIIVIVQAQMRQERGWDRPELPIGIWEAAGSVIGNASGGTKVVQVNLRTLNQGPVGLAYSLEQLHATDGVEVTGVAEVLISGFGVEGQSSSFSFALNIFATDGGVASVQKFSFETPLFMGVSVSPAASNGLSVILDNEDLIQLDVLMRGYVWGPRSVLQLPGGYQRPAGSIFSA